MAGVAAGSAAHLGFFRLTMTEQRAKSRGPNPRAADALRDGIRRVNQTPVVLACVFVVTLLTALPFSMLMRETLQSHLGNSMLADQVARGVNVQWWSEFTAQAGPLGEHVSAEHHRFRRGARQPQRVCRRREPALAAPVARRRLSSAVAVPDRRHRRPLRARAADTIV